ncbi:MAG: carboxypeptidase-like regulatory domain-containing protein, partial [Bacteroidales bacterium]|nr:carboxypeptidase-like regulatory domain-containing protein [Bacteroidales bacterium]
MKRFYFLLLLLCVCRLTAVAADIVGKVADSAGTPLDFVNVVLKLADNNEVVGGGITDVDGEFRLEAVPVGAYRLEISFIGYQSIEKQIIVEQEAQTINVRTLKLQEDAQLLGEVEVVGQGSQMRFDIDKKVFSVDQSVAAAGGSATEVLENIPSVEVDNDGNISLRSNSSVEIWINGKPSGLDEDNRAQILEQLPAGSIESIEVITNPSAKFSPEGTAGIINIILKKDRRGGFFGSVTGGIDYQIVDQVSGNASANFNYS